MQTGNPSFPDPAFVFWRLTLRNQLLTTALFIPFIGYFCLLVGGLSSEQAIDFTVCLGYAGFQDFVFHSLVRRLRLWPILRGIQSAPNADEISVWKSLLLHYPFREAALAPVRWYLGMGTIYLLFVTRHDVSHGFLLNLLLLPTTGTAVAWYTSFMLAESTLAPLQQTHTLLSVSVPPEAIRRMSFTTRFLAAILALALLTVYTFLYLLLEPEANRVFMRNAFLHSAGITVAIAGFSVYVAYLTHAAFQPAFQQTTSAIEAITAGHLSVQIPQFGAHDMSVIGHMINQQGMRLQLIVDQVRQEAQMLAEHATNLNQEAVSLASEASQQARAVEQLSQQLQEIAAAISAAKKSMSATVHAVNQGFQAISEASARMSEIEKHGLDIEETVSVIDKISRQVAMLALNATIEAARAGAEGRGFGVVADEISKLSEQTKSSARAIGEAISTARERIVNGRTVVNHASDQFDRISEYSTDSAGQIDRIGQASGNKFIDSVQQISTVAGHVADSGQRFTKLADGIRAKAHELQTVVKYFD